MPLRSLKSRIVALFLTLIVVVQVGAYLLIETVGASAARNVIEDDLEAGARVLERLLDEEAQRLLHAARGMAAGRMVREVATKPQREAARLALLEGLRESGVTSSRCCCPASTPRPRSAQVQGCWRRSNHRSRLPSRSSTCGRAWALRSTRTTATNRRLCCADADVAMYVAKRNGGGCVVFDERDDPHSRERLSLMRDLRNAVESDQLTLAYQPKLTLRGGSGHRVEALVRWRHPTRGWSPDGVLPFAERPALRASAWARPR